VKRSGSPRAARAARVVRDAWAAPASGAERLHLHRMGTCGLVAMTSAPHAEGRQFDPGQVYCA
jgi:hypothetical protein